MNPIITNIFWAIGILVFILFLAISIVVIVAGKTIFVVLVGLKK